MVTSSPENLSVSLENVCVRYRVPAERFVTFKDYAINWLRGKVRHREFTALQDVSLSVQRGEIFGVIGQNGAGKSTMLKLIARVLQPNSGKVVLNGKVVPLLELGAGFHPELNGRENVFLYGAILGYTRHEMEQKFQSIVEFSELGDFVEFPLRTYSSGMWARLGFAVATDERPDILLVDEVLAVGDEGFQQKCLKRIQQFCDQGTTIVIVSHNMEQIQALCDRAAWLDHGKLQVVGNPAEVIAAYRQAQHFKPT